MPSMRKKMQLKLDFERMLVYKPEDVYYTLYCSYEARQKDRIINEKKNLLEYEIKKT